MKTILFLILLTSCNMFGFFNKKTDFKFKDPGNTACFACSHVVNKQRPILYVTHEEDGAWQFFCGEDGHTEADAKVISLRNAVDLDPTINDLYEMPFNVGADRTAVGEKWQPFRL